MALDFSPKNVALLSTWAYGIDTGLCNLRFSANLDVLKALAAPLVLRAEPAVGGRQLSYSFACSKRGRWWGAQSGPDTAKRKASKPLEVNRSCTYSRFRLQDETLDSPDGEAAS